MNHVHALAAHSFHASRLTPSPRFGVRVLGSHFFPSPIVPYLITRYLGSSESESARRDPGPGCSPTRTLTDGLMTLPPILSSTPAPLITKNMLQVVE